jgi:hypothetical protein
VTEAAHGTVGTSDTRLIVLRGRGFFFPMLSMMDILPGLNP